MTTLNQNPRGHHSNGASQTGPQSAAGLHRGLTLVGASLVALGVLLLLDRLGLEVAGTGVAAWWPAIPLALGLRWLWRRRLLVGLVFTVGGGLLLAATTGVIEANVGAIWLPTLLVLIGIVMLMGSGRRRELAVSIGGDDAAVAVLSSRQWSAAPAELDGANLVSVLGDVDVTIVPGDLVAGSGAEAGVAQEGDSGAEAGRGSGSASRVAASTVTVLGDTDILVPAGWRVTSSVVALLGELSLPTDQPAEPAAPELHLSGVVVLGDCTVRRA